MRGVVAVVLELCSIRAGSLVLADSCAASSLALADSHAASSLADSLQSPAQLLHFLVLPGLR